VDLIFTNAEHTSIKATLLDGEMLGHFTGPIECFVPTDGGNKEYADIIAQGLTVAPYVPPA